MKKFNFYKSINAEKGYEKYIRTSDTNCIVVCFGGSVPIIERYDNPYPVFDGEWLDDCTSAEFYQKYDKALQLKLSII